MKKILLLGGSAQQVVAIETAQKLGYYTVVCDYLPDNPGQYVADKFYPISTTDLDAVLKVAQQEKVNGILAYASDPAAPTAAYVAEKLGLPTNPYESVKILCNKDLFRPFLNKNGFATPRSESFTTVDAAVKKFKKLSAPVIVKPVDSSGSKGVTIVRETENIRKAVEFAFSSSRGKRVIIEDYVEMKHEYLIGGDIFIYNDNIVQWGLLNCHRDGHVNPLVPVGKSYPVFLEKDDVHRVKETLQRIVELLHIKNGAMNVELVIDKDDRVWALDIGPRSGGNMIPDLLGMIFNTDLVEMSVQVAMGEKLTIKNQNGIPYYASHNLHTDREGEFVGVHYSDEILPYLVRECIYKRPGDSIQYFDDASKAIGIVFMKFPSKQKMLEILSNIDNHIFIKQDFR